LLFQEKYSSKFVSTTTRYKKTKHKKKRKHDIDKESGVEERLFFEKKNLTGKIK
jgi:hypothetical protein